MAQGSFREVVEVKGKLKGEPILAEAAKLVAINIGKGDEHIAAGPQEAKDSLQGGLGIGDVFEDVPEGEDVEGGFGERGGGEFAEEDARGAEVEGGFGVGHGHGFETKGIPACVIKSAKERAVATADVEEAAGLAEAFEEGDFVALIAANGGKVRALGAGPVAFAVVGLEFGVAELRLRADESTRAANQ